MKRDIGTYVLFFVACLVAGFVYGFVTESRAPDACTEDMACWDCESMGNGLCGPLSAEINERGYIVISDGSGEDIGVVPAERVFLRPGVLVMAGS